MLLLVCLGCGAPDTPVGERLIAEDPEELFSLATVTEIAPVFEWRFAGAEDLDAWSSVMVDGGLRIEDGALVLRAATDDPQLVREVDLQAEDVQVFRIAARGTVGGSFKFFWSGPGQAFVGERSLLLRHAESRGSPDEAVRTFTFEVGSHPLWGGEIASLRLDPTDRQGQEVRIEEITASKRSIEPERLAGLAAEAWKIDLGNEVRNSLLGQPDRPREWSLELPSDARLVFAWGLIPGVSIPLATASGSPEDAPAAHPPPSFRITVAGENGEEATLFERQPGEPKAGWHDEALDLSAYRGERVVLRFEARSAPGAAGVRGLPVWGNPRIVGPEIRERPGVILISLDTLRADRLGINGYPGDTSPEIDAWARRWGVNFSQAIAQAPWTLPSHVSMFTGQNALTHGENRDRPVSGRPVMMAEILRQAGYSTAAFTGGVYMRPEYGFAQGFDRFRYWPRAEQGEHELEENLDSALGWLERRRGEPFFLFFHTYEIHAPYRARQPFFAGMHATEDQEVDRKVSHKVSRPRREEGYASTNHLYWRDEPTAEPVPLPEDKRPVVEALYASGVAWADHHLGRLFRFLEELELASRTVVVLTSDHGELLGEHGVDGHMYLWDENLKVPLIVSYPPRLPAGGRVSRQVRSIDILPTVLELAGLEIPPPVEGTSLVPLANGDGSAFPDQALSYMSSGNYGLSLRFDRRLKYVLRNSPWLARDRAERLFDLKLDDAESQNLVRRREQQTRSLRARAEAVLHESPGLQLELANRGEEALVGSISFPSLFPGKLTTPELTCGCLTWAEGNALFRIEPAQRIVLAIDAEDDETLIVRAHGESRPPAVALEANLGALEQPVARALTAGVWGPAGAAQADASASIVLRRRGDRRSPRPDPAADRQELDAQLRALGYL